MGEKKTINDQRKNRKNRLFLILLIAILIIASFSSIWYYTQLSKQRPISNTKIVSSSVTSSSITSVSSIADNRELALDFSLVDIEGNSFSLSDFRGKIVIVDFMAIWCGPCKDQIPHYGIVWEQYRDEVVIISIDVDPNETSEMLADFSSNFPYATWIWAADASHLGIDYEIYSIPTTIVVDQNGYISSRHIGVTKSPALIEEIEQLLS